MFRVIKGLFFHCLGPLHRDHVDIYRENNFFNGKSFPEAKSKQQTLKKKMPTNFSKEGLDFLEVNYRKGTIISRFLES